MAAVPGTVREGAPLPICIPDEYLEFISEWTSSTGKDALRQHVLSFWRTNTAKHHAYKCIQKLGFLFPRYPGHPFYSEFIMSMTADSAKKVLEVGVCFGTDVRFLLTQGVLPSQIYATDLHSGYYELGKELFESFQDTPNSSEEPKKYPTNGTRASQIKDVRAVFGDMAAEHADPGAFDVASLGLGSALDFVSCFAVLHVLSRAEVARCLLRLHSLLKPGGTLFGWCVGSSTPGPWTPTPNGKSTRYLHSAETLAEELKSAGFAGVDCSVASVKGVWPHFREAEGQMEESQVDGGKFQPANVERELCRVVFTCQKPASVREKICA